MLQTSVPLSSIAVPRFALGPQDRVCIDGLEYTCARSNEDGHVLARVDNPAIHEFITHAQFNLLRRSYTFRHDRDWFSPEAAALRVAAGTSALRDLPELEQATIHWKLQYCRMFAEMTTADPEVDRNDDARQAAIDKIAETVQPGTKKSKRKGKRVRPASGNELPDPPCPRTLGRWIAKLETHGWDLLALRDKLRNCGNRTPRYSPVEYALLMQRVHAFADERRPGKRQLYKDMVDEFEAENARRAAQGLPKLRTPGRDKLSKEINALNKFKVMAGREGRDKAKCKFTPVNGGNGATRPLERVEIDMWDVQLHVLCIQAGIWHSLPDDLKIEVLSRTRMYLCAAVCCATRCILAMRLVESETAQAAVDTLAMAVSDKQPFADAVGALTPWDMCGTMKTLPADNGSGFVADLFKSAARDLGVEPLFPPAGLPFLRGTIERAFRTAHTQLIARFTGRSFENVVIKGDYPAKARATLTIEELAWVLVRYVVDIYHNTPHEELDDETPRARWLRSSKAYPVMPPPDVHKRRAVFGVDITRKVTNRGVRVFGIFYQHPELHKLFCDTGGTDVEVRVDPNDLAFVSIRLGRAWLAVEAPDETFHGLDADTWIEATRDLRRRNKNLARLVAPVVREAVAAIRKLSDNAIKRANIGETTLTSKQIDHLERELAIGFEYVNSVPDLLPLPGSPPADFYDNAIDVGAKPPQTPPAPKPPPRTGGKTWSLE